MRRGMKIAVSQLSERLGIPVIEVQANRRRGIDPLAAEALTEVIVDRRHQRPPAVVREEVAKLEGLIATERTTHETASELHNRTNGRPHGAAAVDRLAWPRYLVERFAVSIPTAISKSGLPGNGAVHAELVAARKRLADAGCSVTAVEAMGRYEWIGRILDSGVTLVARTVDYGHRSDRPCADQ